jgi:hypothetical protein
MFPNISHCIFFIFQYLTYGTGPVLFSFHSFKMILQENASAGFPGAVKSAKTFTQTKTFIETIINYTILGYKLYYHIVENSRLTTYSSLFYFRD